LRHPVRGAHPRTGAHRVRRQCPHRRAPRDRGAATVVLPHLSRRSGAFPMRLRHLSLPAAAVAAALALSACGAEVDDTASSADGYPVTVTNCGEELEFAAPPEHVVVNDVNMIEMMFALGLEDRMAGYVLSDGHEPSVEYSQWAESFDQVPRLGSTGLELEMIQGADADLVFAGWNYGFTDTGVTPERLAGLGIDSYLLTESCRQDGTTA